MAERVYTTEGIVLKRALRGEANVAVSLFTKELGLIQAEARSARYERSKLRYGLSLLAHGTFSVVAGKAMFKVIGAERVSSYLPAATPVSARALAHMSALLLRLVPQGERQPTLFGRVQEGFQLMSSEEDQDVLESVECVLALRMLHALGYLPDTEELQEFIGARTVSREFAHALKNRRSEAVRVINASLLASGL